MTKMLNYLWRLWFLVLGTVATIIFGVFILVFLFKKKHYPLAFFFIRCWCFFMFYGMGFSYKLIDESGESVDPNTHYIFISNHTSIMDIALMGILHPNHPICFVGKKELEKLPVFGLIYKRVCVTVDRNDPKSRKNVFRKCAKRMREGQNVVIYPEGGVDDDPNVMLSDFKNGAFVLSSQYKFPIVVYTFVGLKEMFPFIHSQGYPGRVKVYRNRILNSEKSVEDLKEEAYKLILNTLKQQ